MDSDKIEITTKGILLYIKGSREPKPPGRNAVITVRKELRAFQPDSAIAF